MENKIFMLSESEYREINGGHTGDATTCPECSGKLPGTDAFHSHGMIAAVQTYAVMAYCWISSL